MTPNPSLVYLVLNKGTVQLVDFIGDDYTPALAARVSYGDGSKGEEADIKLLRYLHTNEHMTPFEMIELVWEVKAPIFIARQWMRHRAASYNEFSMRYADPSKLSDNNEIEYYTPEFWRSEKKTNKQGSVPGATVNVSDSYQGLLEEASSVYDYMRHSGVASEMARFVIPVAAYTKFIYKVDMRNFLGFLHLRMDEHAQWEMRQYAQAMHNIARVRFPHIMELFDNDHPNFS